MECPSCGVVIPDDRLRARDVAVRCLVCTHSNVPGARFCSNCGAKMARGDAAPGEAPVGAPAMPFGAPERRQLTVMMCDLVGSTDLSVRLDVEDYRDLIGAYGRRIHGVVTQYGGFVAKYMGDGALAYFGYPKAHEDDAERATRAGLALVEAMTSFNPLPDCKLEVRVGIETGMVVVGHRVEGSAEEHTVVGATPNLAARLQALAEPNSVVISASTRQLIGKLFDLRDLGPATVKGFSEPVRAWQVLRAMDVENRFEALRTTDARLVGRKEELALLTRRWHQAKGGEGRVVLIGGEPGIGKSRIVRAFEERISREPHIPIRWFCSPHHQDTPLYPVVRQLERAAGIERSDSAPRKLERLRTLLAGSSRNLDHDTRLLAELLRIETGGDVPQQLNPEKYREALLQVLLAQFHGLAATRPVLVVVDDAQWIDPTSQELLQQVVDGIQALPALLIVTFRSEFQAPWIGLPHVTTLSFSRLNQRERMALITDLTRGKRLSEEVAEQIAERTDGVPLFIEEFTRTVMELGLLPEQDHGNVVDRPMPAFAIPTTLRGSLLARLDRPSVRDVVQAGAVIGREFSHEMLTALTLSTADELRKALDHLVAIGLLLRGGIAPHSIYIFRHCLVMDAAYDTLLRRKRRELHARVATVLEDRRSELVETQPELLARHWAQAGVPEKAVGYWQRAARQAMARGAAAEAVAQLRKALTLLAEVPESGERSRQELDLQIALGGVLMAARGYAVSETDAAFSRARELCEREEHAPLLLPITWGQFSSRFVGGKQKPALAVARELLDLSERMDDPGGRQMGYACVGTSLVHLGAILQARVQFERALEIGGGSDRDLAFLYGQSPRVTALAYMSLGLLLMGLSQEAQLRSAQSLREAEALSHPPSLCFAYSVATRVQLIRHDQNAVADHAAAVTKLASAHGLRLWQALGTIYSGWAQAGAGNLVEGIVSMRKGLTQYRATGSQLSLPFYLATLASAYASAGNSAEALKVLSDALQAGEAQEERWITADIHRRIGEVLLSSPRRDEAEAESELRTAIAIARRQGAKLWQLRAATTLARLLREQGNSAAARCELDSIDDSLAGAFDAADLSAAREQLGELR